MPPPPTHPEPPPPLPHVIVRHPTRACRPTQDSLHSIGPWMLSRPHRQYWMLDITPSPIA
eukprot:4094476-Karenia_brevis.AAC.1